MSPDKLVEQVARRRRDGGHNGTGWDRTGPTERPTGGPSLDGREPRPAGCHAATAAGFLIDLSSRRGFEVTANQQASVSFLSRRATHGSLPVAMATASFHSGHVIFTNFWRASHRLLGVVATPVAGGWSNRALNCSTTDMTSIRSCDFPYQLCIERSSSSQQFAHACIIAV